MRTKSKGVTPFTPTDMERYLTELMARGLTSRQAYEIYNSEKEDLERNEKWMRKEKDSADWLNYLYDKLARKQLIYDEGFRDYELLSKLSESYFTRPADWGRKKNVVHAKGGVRGGTQFTHKKRRG
jgi:hypothetical protein